jgi:ribosomal protein S18 acetylase RimI-like enzyme
VAGRVTFPHARPRNAVVGVAAGATAGGSVPFLHFRTVEVTIRDARPSDAQALAALIGQLGYPASAEAVVRRLERLSSSGTDRVVVAALGGEAVGLACLHTSLSVAYDEPAAKVSVIVVDELHRRRGIGEALVQEMEREAKRRQCCLIFLTTAGHRDDAHAFYEGIGFEETGRRFAKPLG